MWVFLNYFLGHESRPISVPDLWNERFSQNNHPIPVFLRIWWNIFAIFTFHIPSREHRTSQHSLGESFHPFTILWYHLFFGGDQCSCMWPKFYWFVGTSFCVSIVWFVWYYTFKRLVHFFETSLCRCKPVNKVGPWNPWSITPTYLYILISHLLTLIAILMQYFQNGC